ncbi:2-methylaconitate cis-trans isomerase PrpF family protein [Caballeronia humi]|uniref:2-methylaconitate cis-trans isomerase PrpF family protein n=1 Tax=Caballeronia humi TaxID=326474 RepID=UPI001F340063|nr:2-methylaconitate cis-trans isomerase PrpF family protein [Caballeronia humi]
MGCPGRFSITQQRASVAGAIAGTVVNRLVSGTASDQIRIGHPSGVMAVGAEAESRDGTWVMTKANISRECSSVDGWLGVRRLIARF